MPENYDVIVLGSGPGGYVAAIRCAQLGLKTAIVERAELGGICLNWGCIPTKALLRSAEVLYNIRHAESFGLEVADGHADINAVVKRSRAVAQQLNQGVAYLMRKNKITVHAGEGRLAAADTVAVVKNEEVRELQARAIILATGARARELPFAPADGERIWTYRKAMTPSEIPEKLLIIGSGAIGIEFASFYQDMGSKVTIVEALDRLMPAEDAETSDFMRKALRKRGMDIRLSADVRTLEATSQGIQAGIHGQDGKITSEAFTHAIVAIGIVPNSEGLGLEALGIETKRGHVVTDPLGRTSIPNIYAIGDLTEGPWLAHKASHEGMIAAEAIARALGSEEADPQPIDRRNIPACIYSRPQVASVGLNETQAKEAGYTLQIGRFPFLGNGKAIALGETKGFIKTIFDAETGKMLGAHLVGADVTELIQGYVVGQTMGISAAGFAHVIFPHPTLSEAMHESILSSLDREIHI